MLKKTIKYTDFNGDEQTEDFYFNLTKAELLEMELSEKGGMNDVINKIIASDEPKKLVALFKQMISAAYGVRSEDGKRFTKSPELTREFESTGAYSELFVELATNDGSASAFVNGLMPADLIEQSRKAQEETAQTARERSQAQLQGHKSPQQKSDAQGSSFVNVPDVPTTTEAPSVVERTATGPAVVDTSIGAAPTPESPDPIAESQEAELARLRAQLASRTAPETSTIEQPTQ